MTCELGSDNKQDSVLRSLAFAIPFVPLLILLFLLSVGCATSRRGVRLYAEGEKGVAEDAPLVTNRAGRALRPMFLLDEEKHVIGCDSNMSVMPSSWVFQKRGTLPRWDLESGSWGTPWPKPKGEYVLTFDISPDRRWLALSSGPHSDRAHPAIRLYGLGSEVEGALLYYNWSGGNNTIFYGSPQLKFTPDGKYLVAIIINEYIKDNMVAIWETSGFRKASGRAVFQRRVYGGFPKVNAEPLKSASLVGYGRDFWPLGLSISPDSRLAYVLLRRGTVMHSYTLLQVSIPGCTSQAVFENAKDVVDAVFLQRNGSTALLKQNVLEAEGRVLIECPKGARGFSALSESPTHDFIALGCGTGHILLVDPTSWKIERVFTGHRRAITSMAFSKDGTRLYSSSADKTLNEWDVDAVRQVVLARQEQERLDKEKERLYTKTAPANLVVQVGFDDSESLVPNKALDAGDSGQVSVEIENQGDGIAFGAVLDIQTDNVSIKPGTTEALGDVAPGASKSIAVSLNAGLGLGTGEAKVFLQVKEKRGYDSKPVELVLATRELIPPELDFDAVNVEDRTAGLTRGNGNGIPENGETLELICLVRNRGRGAALKTSVVLECDQDRFRVEKPLDEISEIEPGTTARGLLRFRVPRTDSCAPMDLTVVARDGRGASEAKKVLQFTPSMLQPKLMAEQSVQGIPASGDRFTLSFAVRNEGTLAAENVRLAVRSSDPGIAFRDNTQDIGSVRAAGEVDARLVAVDVPRGFAKSTIALDVSLQQGDFPEWTHSFNVDVQQRVVNLVAETKQRAEVHQGEALNLVIGIRNRGSLEARNVQASLDSPSSNVRWLDDTGPFSLGTIAPGGESKTISARLMAMRSAEPGSLPVVLRLTHADFPETEQEIFVTVLPEEAAQVVVQADEEPAITPPTAAAVVPGASQPPQVVIITPIQGQRLTMSDMQLRGRIWDDRGIDHFTITVNGVQVGDKGVEVVPRQQPKGVFQDFSTPVVLQPGRNVLRVEAFDTDNLRAEETVTVEYVAPERAVWVVAIGINDYQDNRIGDLKFAEADARGFAAYMRDDFGVPADHVELLCGPDADRQNVVSTLGTKLRSQAHPDDTVIIYYSGHGAPEQDPTSPDGDSLEKYLLPCDADPSDLFTSAVSMEQIAGIFGRLRAERVVFLADTCYSGASGGKTLPSPQRAVLSAEFLERISRGKGRVIITASGANELSREDIGLGHGVFTHYLLEGLKGAADKDGDGDGYVTVQEAYSYVSRKVPSATKQQQHPVLKGDIEGTLILGRVRDK